MNQSLLEGRERRRHERRSLDNFVRVQKLMPVLPVSDAEVIDASLEGIAIRTSVPIHVGERLSFHVKPSRQPMLAKVLATDRMVDGSYRVRCRCLLERFDMV